MCDFQNPETIMIIDETTEDAKWATKIKYLVDAGKYLIKTF